MNHSDNNIEEKFKFEFLIIDEESTGYINLTELERIIKVFVYKNKINFMFKEEKDVKNKIKLMKEKYKLV